MPARAPSTDSALEELLTFGLTYPGAHTKSPWPGHLDLAVNDKTFAYLSVAGDPFKISCKLPRSVEEALSLPFVTPTEYGLGKSGWVTARLPDGPVPVDMFKAWIDESYRAQAPKRLSAALPELGDDGEGAEKRGPAAQRSRPRAMQKPPSKTRPAKKVSAKKDASLKKKVPAKKSPAPRRAAKTAAAQPKRAKKKRRAG